MTICAACNKNEAVEASLFCNECFSKEFEIRRAKLQQENQQKEAAATTLSPAQIRAKHLAEEMAERRFNAAMGADSGGDHGNNSTGLTDMKGPMKTLGLDE